MAKKGVFVSVLTACVAFSCGEPDGKVQLELSPFASGYPACGDGVMHVLEECDDGKIINGDGCSANCQREICGDAIQQVSLAEECDDGNQIDGDGCSAKCKKESCLLACGNGIVDSGEQCDGNDFRTAACSDYGYESGDLFCNSSCKIETTGCYNCGDGFLQPAEQCDDGNRFDGEGCSSKCKIEYCGDGTVQIAIGEECDDGHLVNGDGCSSSCKLEKFTN